MKNPAVLLARLASKCLQNPHFITIIDFCIDGAALLTRWVGKLFVIVVFALTSLVMTSYYFVLLPYLLDLANEFLILFHLLFGHYLLINIVFHYFYAVRTNPGFVLNAAKVDKKDIAYFRRNYSQTRICKHCCQVKPNRAYHCSICQKCVIKMEHHCPWINNCVGVLNHKFYLLFCWFMWIGTGYMMVSLYPLFSNIYKSHARGTFTDGFMSKDRQIQGWLNNYYSHVSGEDAKYAASNMGEDQVIESMGYSRYSVYLKILRFILKKEEF